MTYIQKEQNRCLCASETHSIWCKPC